MKAEPLPYEGRIVQVPGILGGKPTIKGTRISVEIVLAHLASNLDFEDLLRGFPALTPEDVQACLKYAQEQLERIHDAKRRRRLRAVQHSPA